MDKVWIVEQGRYYNDRAYGQVVCATKKRAVELCRADGFSYSRKQDLWSNARTMEWRHVFDVEYYI